MSSGGKSPACVLEMQRRHQESLSVDQEPALDSIELAARTSVLHKAESGRETDAWYSERHCLSEMAQWQAYYSKLKEEDF